VQVSSNSLVLASAPVDEVPLVATAPLQPPDAVHAVAFAEVQVNVDIPPLATVVGEADKVTVGAGETTTTSADCEACPPGPVQVKTYVVFAINGSVVMVPLVGWLPLQPPEAVQLCASLALHCKVVDVPLATLVFIAASVTDGFASLVPGELKVPVKLAVSADDD